MIAELRPYLALLRGRRWRMLTGAALLFATTTSAMALLAISGWFVTAAAVMGTALGIFVPGAAIRAFALTRTLARYAERVYNHDVVLRLLADLRVAVFKRLSRLDVATLRRFRAAELLHRLTADIDTLDTLYLRALAPPLVALAAIAALSGVLAGFVPRAGGVAGVALGTVWLLAVVFGLRLGGTLPAAINARAETLRARVIEQVEGLPELIGFGSQARHRAVSHAEASLLTEAQQRLAARAALGGALVTFGVQLASVLVLLAGVLVARDGAVTAPIVVLMALAVLGLGELLGALPNAFLQLGRARAAAAQLTRQTAVEPAIAETSTPVDAPICNALDAVDLVAGRGQRPILNGLTLHIASGERVGVIGTSGCGKSTLADSLARLQEPLSGYVALGRVVLPVLRFLEVRERIAYLTQRSELFDASIAENLRLAVPQAEDAALWEALRVAGLAAFVSELEAGLHTQVGESGGSISGGQARRLALARVVLRGAPVVLLDEPLAGLDRETAALVGRRLMRWLSGRTALLLGHDPTMLPPCDRYLRLCNGRLERLPITSTLAQSPL